MEGFKSTHPVVPLLIREGLVGDYVVIFVVLSFGISGDRRTNDKLRLLISPSLTKRRVGMSSNREEKREIKMSLKRDPRLIQIINEQTRTLRKNSTPAEKILWEKLRNRKFLNYKFYRQYPVIYDIEGKETFFVLDFYCHKKKIAIEVDGEIHKSRINEDKRRDEILNKLGIEVIRFTNRQVEENLNDTLNKLKTILNLKTDLRPPTSDF